LIFNKNPKVNWDEKIYYRQESVEGKIQPQENETALSGMEGKSYAKNKINFVTLRRI